jgi:hypothetical protein
MAQKYGFIDTKEMAMQKQKEIYQENKKHAEKLAEAEKERLNSDKNYRRDKRLKAEKQNVMFHNHVSVGGNAAASSVVSGSHGSINVNTLIGCRGGQSVGDKFAEDANNRAKQGRKGLSLN